MIETLNDLVDCTQDCVEIWSSWGQLWGWGALVVFRLRRQDDGARPEVGWVPLVEVEGG